MKFKTCWLSVALIGAFASYSFAIDPIIFDNGVVPDTGFSSQFDTAYPFDSQVADDFSLPTGNGQSYDVTGIDFTGLQFNEGDPPVDLPNPSTFNIIFYDDAGGVPVGGPSDPTALGIVRTVSILAPEPAPGPYSFTTEFAPVTLDPATTYWVAVQHAEDFPPQFGWQADGAGGNAVQGFPLLGTDYWAPIGAETDFQLRGEQVPEPSAALLVLGGLIGLLKLRRR